MAIRADTNKSGGTIKASDNSGAFFLTSKTAGLQFFKSGFLVDTTLVCADGTEIKTHSFVLGSNSGFFSRAFRSDFKESRTKRFELNNDVAIPHLNNTSAVIRRMLEFMYSGGYSLYPGDDQYERNMCLNIDLYVAADYYGVGNLQQYATTRFARMSDNWDKLKPAFPEIITRVYSKPESTISGIRNTLLMTLVPSMVELKDDKSFMDFFKGVGECAVDVMAMMYRDHKPNTEKVIRTVCHFCNKDFVVELLDDHTPAFCTRCGKSNYNQGLRRRTCVEDQ